MPAKVDQFLGYGLRVSARGASDSLCRLPLQRAKRCCCYQTEAAFGAALANGTELRGKQPPSGPSLFGLAPLPGSESITMHCVVRRASASQGFGVSNWQKLAEKSRYEY